MLFAPMRKHPNHPALRYALNRYQAHTPLLWRIVRVLVQVIAFAGLVVVGYLVASDFGARPVTSWQAVLYWPLVLLGVIVGLATIMLTGNIITSEKVRGTWDSLRLTTHGAEMLFSARWLSTFYNLRGPLTVLLVARFIFVGTIVLDLGRLYRGHYLDLLLSGITPGVPVPLGVVILGATLAAAVLQPVVAVATDAAVGLMVSVLVRNPRYDVYVRILLGVFRIAFAVVALWVGTGLFAAPEQYTALTGNAALLIQGVAGDQGLRLLNLAENGLLWLDVPYSVLSGPILFGVTLVQAVVVGRAVSWIARRAEQVE